VVEEYRAPDIQPVPFTHEPVIVPLSARTPEALRQRARDLLDFIRTAQGPLDLASIAYTLQTGREAMDERMALVVSSVEQLAEKLRAFAAGERGVDGVHQGRIEPGSDGLGMFGRDDDMQETIDKWVTRGKFSTLADAWARGLSFDWSRLYGQERPRRLSLPTYPFAKERCWFDGGSGAPAVEEEIALDADVRTIEDIINQFDENAIDTEHAVHALKMLV
ncbi:MAG TPA: hypothetical protein VFO89_12055, partial [Thermoanaerobaculia bacterium]|nr:hypothetical protein [Thermoanaerobaculia bacterium]